MSPAKHFATAAVLAKEQCAEDDYRWLLPTRVVSISKNA